MIDFPAIPSVPVEHTISGETNVRYEDLSQDGRFFPPSIFTLGTQVVWTNLLFKHPLTRALYKQGIIPIFSRMIVEGSPGPFGVLAPISAKGGYQLAHTGRGAEVERILINLWAELSGRRDRIKGQPPPGAGELMNAGRFFVEQVLTRPFAAPEQRKVLRLDIPGFPEIPEARHPFREHADITSLPAGAVPLEPGMSPDVAPIVFGLRHTDSNQHINSLVYPRMFEDAALRRFAALGAPLGLGRAFEVGFRKPFFAGDQARILLQAFTLGERAGAAGVFIAEGDMKAPELARPYCTLRMMFER